MTQAQAARATVPALDDATRALVRVSAVIAAGSEDEIRAALAEAYPAVPMMWMEELILQSYLFAGFPRALNAAREWRRLSGIAAPASDEGERFEDAGHWRERGEATCATVYGPFDERLRHNLRGLHPALESWMIVEGYGKVLGRSGLDLKRRELCVMAACAAARQSRQLHSHLHGCLHAGATREEVDDAIETITPLLGDEALGVRMLWGRVAGKGRGRDS